MTSAIASFLIICVIGMALVMGLNTRMPPSSDTADLVAVLMPNATKTPRSQPSAEPTQTPKRQAEEAQTARMKEAASPPNMRNQASAVFAPLLRPLIQPAPIIAAPRPAAGHGPNTGASDRLGPGQGAGGIGDGTGGGGTGNGNGDGDGDAIKRPIQTKGKLRWSDLPKTLRETHQGGELELVYRVNAHGSVSDCRVTQSSGLPSLDAQTCRLISERFRFRPARNARGKPVPSHIIERHGWDPAPDDVTDTGDD